jgi:phosphoribosylanthranilate isomerase
LSAKQRRTRIKICGLTRAVDVAKAVRLGADALGFVLWPGSPRHVGLKALAALTAEVPPFVATVGLFVNATRADVEAAIGAARLSMLQFHGDESPEACAGFTRPHLRAARVRPGLDLLEFNSRYAGASALLLDSDSAFFGGSGKAFDWSLIPAVLAPRVVLSGGLNAQNVADAIARVRPYAVDVSSGVEASPGIKDDERLCAFFREVARADAS